MLMLELGINLLTDKSKIMKRSNRLYRCLQIVLVLILIHNKLLAQCNFFESITVSASSFEVSNTQQYILVLDNAGVQGDISVINNSSNFTNVTAGNYWLYAVNYEGAQPLALSVGSPWSGVVTYDANMSNCFESSLAYFNSVLGVCNIPEVCKNDDISVSSSGETSGAGFTQTFVLVDSVNQILGFNTSGIFPISTYVNDGDFFVYSVNTDENIVNNEINDLGIWQDISDMQGGGLCLDINAIPIKVLDTTVCGSTLPVELLSFQGQVVNEVNLISWKTLTEINNDYFELEASEDGIHFYTIYKVNGAGNSNLELAYEFKHFNYLALTYYRLKQIDFDGTLSKSRVISIKREANENNSIKTYPTLISDNVVNIDLNSTINQIIEIKIENILGQQIFFEQKELFIGLNYLSVKINASNGCYFVTIYINNEKHTQKIIIDM